MATMRSRSVAAVSTDRAGDHRPAAAPAGAQPERGEGGVALDRVDVLDVDAERVRRDLHGGGLEAVAGRAAGDVHVDLAGGLDADGGALGAVVAHRRGGGLDVAAGADADVAAVRTGLGLLLAERVVVEDLEGLLEHLPRRHAVVGHAVAVRVRQLVGAEDVAAAQLDRVHVHAAGGDVEQHLAGERLERPRPPVGGAAGRVGEDRRRRSSSSPGSGTGPGRASRPQLRCRPATASGRRRRPARGRSARRAACRRRRTPSWSRCARGGPVRPT